MKKYLMKEAKEILKGIALVALTCFILWLCKPWLFQWWVGLWLTPKMLGTLLFGSLFLVVFIMALIVCDTARDVLKLILKNMK